MRKIRSPIEIQYVKLRFIICVYNTIQKIFIIKYSLIFNNIQKIMFSG
jgi:hypothetical protein